MDETAHAHNQRWYDEIGELTLALHFSRMLPPEIRRMIVRNLNEAINDARKHSRTDKQAVSLGSQHLLGLYKAGQRRRWYDPEPESSRAFNFMSTVPRDYLADFAERILRIRDYVAEQRRNRPHYVHPEELNTVDALLQKKGAPPLVPPLRENPNGLRLIPSTQARHSTYPK